MSLDIDALNLSFYTALNVASIIGSVTGIYHVKAPQGTAYPYITYFAVIDVQGDTFTEWGSDALFQLDVWSDSNSAAESGAIVKLITAQMDDKVLSIPGYNDAKAIRDNLRLLYETETGRFHQVVEYNTRWSKSM